jgi:hypothetical protein
MGGVFIRCFLLQTVVDRVQGLGLGGLNRML